MSKISELSDGGSLVSSDYLIAVRSGGNVKVRMDQINVDQIDLGDNEFIRLGNSQDLTIVHDASNSIINQAGIGNLLIQKAGSTKLTVNSTGIDVTGTVTTDGLTSSGPINLTAGALAAAGNAGLSHRSTDNKVYLQAGTGGFNILDDQQNTHFALDSAGVSSFYGNVGIGRTPVNTLSPSLELVGGGSLFGFGNSLYLAANLYYAGGWKAMATGAGASYVFDSEHKFYTNASVSANATATPVERLRITSAGALQLSDVNSPNDINTAIYSNSDVLEFEAFGTNGAIAFSTGSGVTEAARFDSSQNFLVGGTSTNPTGQNVVGAAIDATGEGNFSVDGAEALRLNRKQDGDIQKLMVAGATVGKIGSLNSNRLYFGGADTGIMIASDLDCIYPTNGGDTARSAAISLGNSGTTFKDLYLSGTIYAKSLRSIGVNGAANEQIMAGISGVSNGYMINQSAANELTYKWHTGANSQGMTFTNDGNLLVSKTSLDVAAVGQELRASGYMAATRDGSTVGSYTRLNSDGTILEFRKDSSTVGSLGAVSDSLYISSPYGSDAGLRFAASIINPCTTVGADRDDAIDLGKAGARFDDIYATNGTIQTSDRNEKQDIEALSDAEQRVAVAAKGLLRKFRWISSVEENGDEARTHFGIIAQDLQAAFEAEGLDAGDYAMFINSTWTDEETGEERSRMGVRYSELLAFIIAAI